MDAGHEISLSIPRNVKKGDAVTVFIRPERLRINKSSSAKSLTSISGFTYLGNAAHIQLISNKQIINVTLPVDDVKNFKKGDLIEIEFPKDNAK